MIKYILCWIPLVAIAILNGTVRELWYKKNVNELNANQISTLSLIVLIGIYSYFMIKLFPPNSAKQALIIGFIWAILTLIFEFSFGLFRGNSWKQLFYAYNFMEGQLWILVPIWLIVAPYLAFKIILK